MALTTYKVVHVGLPEPGEAHNLPRSSPAVVPLPHLVRGSPRLLLLVLRLRWFVVVRIIGGRRS